MTATDPPAWLVNLPDSTGRRASAMAQLDALGLAATVLPAVDGRGDRLAGLPGYDPAGALRHMGRPLRGGEVGCYLSHVAAARAFLAHGADLGLVLEDDLALDAAGAATLRAAVGWLRARPDLDWHLLNAGANRLKIHSPLVTLPGGVVLSRAHYFPMTTTALIWSRAGAEAFLARPLAIDAPIDNDLRRWLTRSDRGLVLWPAPVGTTGAASEIDDRAGRRSAEGRTLLYGLVKQRRLLAQKARASLSWAAHRLRR